MSLQTVRVIEVPASSRGKPQAKHGFFMDLSKLNVKHAIKLYHCQDQSEWKDWMDRVFNEQGVYRDPFVGVAGHTSTDLASMSMSKSREATVLLEAVRNRRRPNRFGWRYPEDYHPVGVGKMETLTTTLSPLMYLESASEQGRAFSYVATCATKARTIT